MASTLLRRLGAHGPAGVTARPPGSSVSAAPAARAAARSLALGVLALAAALPQAWGAAPTDAAKAASEPGLMAKCSSHLSAVSVRRGSMQMSLAPLRLACMAMRQKCRLLVMGLLPQITISLA